MDRSLKWTKINIVLLLLIAIKQVLSDNTKAGAASPAVQTLCLKESPHTSSNNASPTPQLLNTLLTIAAANGVLPDLLPKLQPLGITPPETLATAQEAPRTATVPITQQPLKSYQQEPVLASTQQIISTSNTNSIIPSQLPTTHTTPSTIVPVQPLVISPGLKQTTQQSNPFIPQISELVQTQSLTYDLSKEENNIPTTILPEQTNNNIRNQIAEILHPGPMAATILTTESGQSFPVNLQITIPPPYLEAPRITFINAPLPAPAESSTTKVIDQYPYSNWCPYGYPAPAQTQEIIVRKKKSWIKDLLPFIVFSMLKDDHKPCDNERHCCCSCNSGRRNTPVPYPIPIPTNNPIINTGFSNLSRKRGHKSDDDDEDDWLV